MLVSFGIVFTICGSVNVRKAKQARIRDGPQKFGLRILGRFGLNRLAQATILKFYARLRKLIYTV